MKITDTIECNVSTQISPFKRWCILGVLASTNGISIQTEMLEWLSQSYNVISCKQTPPGALYEFPAIYLALLYSCHKNIPILYIHTKGAANPSYYSGRQYKIRNMWKYEFLQQQELYFDSVNTSLPRVACPYTNSNKATIFNGFVINTAASHELLKTFHITSNRFYYENMFKQTNIGVTPIRLHDMQDNCTQMFADLDANFT